MTRKNKPQQPKDDFNFQIKFKLSSKLKESVATATKTGKVIIAIGKILIPLILAASIALQQVTPQPPLPPESTHQSN